jgi:ribonuclease P protein subunit RPR2
MRKPQRNAARQKEQKAIGRERIEVLFEQAGKSFPKEPARAHRYVQMARKMAMRYNIRMPKAFKRKYCRGCGKFLVPGKNSTVRTARKSVTVKCLECGHVMRFPLAKKAK